MVKSNLVSRIGSVRSLLKYVKKIPILAPVDERPELPADPKVRFFGRNPETAVAVKLDYIEDPKEALKTLADYIFRFAGNPNYDTTKKDLWTSIYDGVICSGSREA